MRALTHAYDDTHTLYLAVEERWRTNVAFNYMPLVFSNRPPPRPHSFPLQVPFALLLVIPRSRGGAALRLTARHTDPEALRRVEADLPSLFRGEPVPWDGGELHAGNWYWSKMWEMGGRYATDAGEVVHLLAAECQLAPAGADSPPADPY